MRTGGRRVFDAKFGTAAAVALLFVVCLGLLLHGGFDLSKAIQGGEPASRHQQEPANAQTDAPRPPSFVALFLGRDLEETAAYCASDQQDKAKKWIVEHWCGVKRTDVVSAFSALGSAVLTLCLLAVGALQFWVVRTQARISATQAEIMGRQADISAEQLVAAKEAADAAARSATIAEQAMIYTQRAFLFSGTPNIDQVLLNGEVARMAVTVKWRNLGNTAARRIRTYAEVLAFQPRMEAGYAYRTVPLPDTEDPSATLAPKDELVLDPILPPVEWFSLAHRGEGQVCIIGWIEYNDVFPATSRRRTEIFWKITVRADPCVAVNNINECLAANRYGPHNGTDEDCLHKPMT